MNKLVLSLLLACGVVNAEEYWTTPTQQGGEIVLTKATSENCGDVLLVMYVITADQRVAYGCWALLNGKVHVRYDDGDRMAYDLKNWTKKGTP